MVLASPYVVVVVTGNGLPSSLVPRRRRALSHRSPWSGEERGTDKNQWVGCVLSYCRFGALSASPVVAPIYPRGVIEDEMDGGRAAAR